MRVLTPLLFLVLLSACTSASPAPDGPWELPPASRVMVPIDSSPVGAVVMVDGQILCRATPCKRMLTPGSHQVRMLLEGHRTLDRVVNLSPGARLSWAMTREGVPLHITAEDPKALEQATLVMDDIPLEGPVPKQMVLNPGPQTVEIRSACHHPLRQSLTVGAKEAVKLHWEAKTRQGQLYIVARDGTGKLLKAEVLVEGEVVGTTPMTLTTSICTSAIKLRYAQAMAAAQVKVREGGVELVRVTMGGVTPTSNTMLNPAEVLDKHGQLQATIKDAGAIYTTINHTSCLKWPSPAIKLRAGSDHWGTYEPKNGDTGPVIWTTTHCGSKLTVYLVQVGPHIVPIGAPGVTVRNQGSSPRLFGTSMVRDATSLPLGSKVRLLSPGHHYAEIHKSDCLTWPVPRGKASAGKRTLRAGQLGTIKARDTSCRKGHAIYLVDFGDGIYPVDSKGLQVVADPQ